MPVNGVCKDGEKDRNNGNWKYYGYGSWKNIGFLTFEENGQQWNQNHTAPGTKQPVDGTGSSTSHQKAP